MTTRIPHQGQDFVGPRQYAAASGAINIKSGVVFITKPSEAAAMTLAAPVAGREDGKILHIIAVTAVAHTLTVSGGANSGGSGADVGTFGGAIGDGVTLVAYNAKWYVLNNINVTFA